MLISFFQRTVYTGKALEDEEAGFSFSRDSTPNTSFSASTTPPSSKHSARVYHFCFFLTFRLNQFVETIWAALSETCTTGTEDTHKLCCSVTCGGAARSGGDARRPGQPEPSLHDPPSVPTRTGRDGDDGRSPCGKLHSGPFSECKMRVVF